MHICFKAINKRKRIITSKMQDANKLQLGTNEMLLGENAIIIKLKWHTWVFSIVKQYIYIIYSHMCAVLSHFSCI